MDRKLNHSDAQLVNAACNGDVDSFRYLYERHYGLAVGIARSRLRDRHLAEDVAQEAFAVACRKLHKLRSPDRFPEWLGTICRRLAGKMARSHERDEPIQDVPAEQVVDDPAIVAVHDALERLPLASREVLTLHYFSGLSYDEIALSLGISRQAVHGRMQRGRRMLAGHLAVQLGKVKL